MPGAFIVYVWFVSRINALPKKRWSVQAGLFSHLENIAAESLIWRKAAGRVEKIIR